ncbi:hypothetical protein [Streptomyces palmae]|uniref:hypothetical protein n=1 Tax=Streptomyces palmae TaxID=1701085 RepID=UPI001AE03934|nr:hypothetical protein [Streptomyces palmae]
MNTTVWDHLAMHHREGSAAMLRVWDSGRDVPPVDDRLVYRTMASAAAPFRAGTRFRALPDVRFLVEGGSIAAPGDLLPDPEDSSAAEYERRLDARMPGQGRLLVVEQPLLLDYELWSQTRRLIDPLWQRIGTPVLPVVTELLAGGGITVAADPEVADTHATLTLVLAGGLTVRPGADGGGGDAPAVQATAGQAVYRPAGPRAEVGHLPGTLALRLRIPVAPRLLHRAVEDVVSGLLQERRYGGEDDAVPYLAYPPVEDRWGATPDVLPLAATAAALMQECEGPRLERVLRILSARRASAGGLEPVPPPRQSPPPEAAHAVRTTAPVLRMPDGDDWIWAVNGHAFALRGKLGELLLERLGEVTDAAPTVDDLCRQFPRSAHAGVLALLRKLHALRAVDLVDAPTDGVPRQRSSRGAGTAATADGASRPGRERTA